MAASEVRIPIVVFVLVCGAALGVMLWRQQHSDPTEVARLASPLPETIAPAPAPSNVSTPEALPKAADTGALPPAPQATEPNVAQPKVAQPKAAEPPVGDGEPPHFDVVRVEPDGEAVIAGKGDPNVKVELLASGRVVAETQADAGGNFVVVPPRLAPGDYDLTLRQTPDGKRPEDSTQSVAVSVPAKGGGAPVVVALAEPGKPTKLMSSPPETPAATAPTVVKPTPPAATTSASVPALAPPESSAIAAAKPKPVVPKPAALAPPPAAGKPASPGLAIRSVELENGNGFFASGTAAPGARVRIYLNGTALAGVIAGPDGQWSVTIKKGLTGGHYKVRADMDAGGDRVASRAEVPFDVPVAMAQASKPGSAPKASEEASLGPESVPPASAEAPLAKPLAPMPRPDIAAAAKAAGAAPVPEHIGVAPPSLEDAAPPLASSIANAVVEQVETAVVVRGDNLWNISRARLGHGKRFTQIYAANAAQIRDPELIYPGQVFVVPPR